MSGPPAPNPELQKRIASAVAKKSSLTRAEYRRQSILVIALSLLPATAVLALRGVPLGGRPLGYATIVAVGWFALAIAASVWTLRPGRTALGRPRPTLAALAVALPASLLLVSLVASAAFPETLRAPTYGWRVHLTCAMIATGLSLAPIGAVLWLRRRSDPVKPWSTGAALGAAAASWAGAVIAAQCPHPEPLHVALAHVAPIALSALVAALVGARVLSLRWIR
jgi:hypothetical protein